MLKHVEMYEKRDFFKMRAEEKLSIGQTAKLVGRTVATLQKWHADGTLVPEYVIRGRRIYTTSQISEFMRNNATKGRNVKRKLHRIYLDVISIVG